MQTPVVKKTKNSVRRQVVVTANQSGALPEWIEIMKTGEWSGNSNKGHLIETVASLNEYKRNFDAGLAQSQNSENDFIGLPIDFMHNDWDKAAGWMRELKVESDANGDAVLSARVEWTEAGRQALLSGEFKCISPSWYPAIRGEWTDPENPDIVAHNVLVGAGLTNIPFFKQLKSLMASNADTSNLSEEDVIYIDAKKKENNSMTVDEVKQLDADKLTDEQKKVLADNIDQLSQEEQVKFGLTAPIVADNKVKGDKTTGISDEDAKMLASIKSGEIVVVEKSEIDGLKASVESQGKVVAEYTENKAKAEFVKHLERGAIKADSDKIWLPRLQSDFEGTSALLASMNDNLAMASKSGGSVDENVITTAYQEVKAEATKLIKTAKENEQVLSEGDAISKVLASNAGLAERYEIELSNPVTA